MQKTRHLGQKTSRTDFCKMVRDRKLIAKYQQKSVSTLFVPPHKIGSRGFGKNLKTRGRLVLFCTARVTKKCVVDDF
jgi:hypothetical protein